MNWQKSVDSITDNNLVYLQKIDDCVFDEFKNTDVSLNVRLR